MNSPIILNKIKCIHVYDYGRISIYDDRIDRIEGVYDPTNGNVYYEIIHIERVTKTVNGQYVSMIEYEEAK